MKKRHERKLKSSVSSAILSQKSRNYKMAFDHGGFGSDVIILKAEIGRLLSLVMRKKEIDVTSKTFYFCSQS